MYYFFFFFKQKTAYEMRISDWSSDVCSSDLRTRRPRRWRPHPDRPAVAARGEQGRRRARRMDEGDRAEHRIAQMVRPRSGALGRLPATLPRRAYRRSEERRVG